MHTEIIAVHDARGKMLGHDVTKIVKDEFKGPLLRKGHVIREPDIDLLQQAGKEHIYVLHLDADDVHEDEAGLRLGRAAAGRGIRLQGPKESRVNLVAEHHGLLKIRVDLLEQINALPDVVLATLPTNRPVAAGETVAGTKVIPLAVKEEIVAQAEALMGQGPLVEVKPFTCKRIGLVVTGQEVYSGRIRDAFAPVLIEKIRSFGSQIMITDFAPDDAHTIAALIRQQVERGAELVLVTGGMSVDPDDVTPAAIRRAASRVVHYGAPVLPGAMFMAAYLGAVPILGVPACAMYFQTTVLDLIMPRLLADEQITKQEIIGLGHGGLCRSCPLTCHFPHCSFGTGGSWPTR